MTLAIAACTQTPDYNGKGSYTNARHITTGSNIPQPDRAGGNSDTSVDDLAREQFQQQQAQQPARTGGGL